MEQEGSDGWDSDFPQFEDVTTSNQDSDVPQFEDVTTSHQDSDVDSDAWGDASDESGWFEDPDVEGQERYYDGSEWTSETRSTESNEPVSHLPDHAGELQRALAAATDDIDDVEDRLGNLFERVEQRGKRSGRGRKEAGEAEAQAVAIDDDEVEEENWLSGESVDVADDRDDGESDDAVAELDDENWLSDDDEDDNFDISDGVRGESDALAESDEETWLSDESLDIGDGDDGERVDDERVESARVESARVDSERPDNERLDSARVDSARVDSARFDEDDDALAELDEALASEEPEKVKRGLFRRN